MTIGPTPRGVVSHRAAVIVVMAAFAVGLGIDVAAKVLAVRTLDPENPPVVLGGLLTLQLIRNPGAAFSIGEDYTWAFAILATLALAAITIFLVPRIRHRGWAVATGLISAGIAGNLIDRMVRPPAPFRGAVVDYLQLPAVGGYQWPIFNFADICVTSGAILVAWFSIVRRVDWDGKTDAQRAREAAAEKPSTDQPSTDQDESRSGEAAESVPDQLAESGKAVSPGEPGHSEGRGAPTT